MIIAATIIGAGACVAFGCVIAELRKQAPRIGSALRGEGGWVK